MVELPWGTHDKINVHDDRIVEARVNPNPSRPVGDTVINRQTELAGLPDMIALAPKIKLIDPDDQNDTQNQIDDVITGSQGLFDLDLHGLLGLDHEGSEWFQCLHPDRVNKGYKARKNYNTRHPLTRPKSNQGASAPA